jgi:hypothetical protein
VIEWLVLLSPWLALACLIIWDARDYRHEAQAASESSAISPDFAALIDAIRSEGQANRREEISEDRGKRFREYLTLFIVIATTAGVFYQAYIFSGQLTEMKSSGEQTAQLIDNNAALAASATKQAEAADKQANAMNAAVEVSRESLIAAGRAWDRETRKSRAPSRSERPSNSQSSMPTLAGSPRSILLILLMHFFL